MILWLFHTDEDTYNSDNEEHRDEDLAEHRLRGDVAKADRRHGDHQHVDAVPVVDVGGVRPVHPRITRILNLGTEKYWRTRE